MMDLTPKPEYLLSLRAERGDVVQLCGEATDNALDAHAHNIRIEINDSQITFADDGDGVLLENFPALFTLGNHAQLSTTRLGRYGIGITTQANNAADVMEVRSISKDGHFLSRVNFRDIGTNGWKVPDPMRLPMAVGTATGTIVKLTVLRKLKKTTADKILDELSQRFYPAIAEGRSITLNRIAVPLAVDPKMTDIIEQTFQFSDGRTASLRAGLIVAPSRLNRVHVGFEHRVIMPGSTLGCSGYTGLNNLFARVQLSGSKWVLSKFKDEIADEDQLDELDEAIGTAMTPILEKCGKTAIDARIAAIGELVNLMLPDELVAARPRSSGKKRRSSGKRNNTKSGKVDPDKSDPATGPAESRRSQKDRLLITFEGKDEMHGIGWFEPGVRGPNRVNLSPNNPSLARLLRCKDDDAVATAMLLVGMELFEQGRSEGSLPLEPYGVRVAQHLLTNNVGIIPKRTA